MFFRRIAAIFYDLILILAILLIGTLFSLIFTKGYAIPSNNLLYKIYLLTLICSFYIGFWVHGGQTLGMKAWGLKLLTLQNKPLSYQHAILRFFLSLFSFLLLGFGFFWALFDPKRQALYDKFLGIRMERVKN